MRPYRGIPIDGKDFVFGWLYKCNDKAYILHKHDATLPDYNLVRYAIHHEDMNVCFIEVIPETVGQATGLKDKKDKGEKEVYEGDIALCSYKETTDLIYRGVITYTPPEFYLACFWESIEGVEDSYDVGANNRSLIRGEWQVDEIIGTIHTHPELIKK